MYITVNYIVSSYFVTWWCVVAWCEKTAWLGSTVGGAGRAGWADLPGVHQHQDIYSTPMRMHSLTLIIESAVVATKLLLLRVRPVGVTPGPGAKRRMVKHLRAQQHQIPKALACTAQWQDNRIKGKTENNTEHSWAYRTRTLESASACHEVPSPGPGSSPRRRIQLSSPHRVVRLQPFQAHVPRGKAQVKDYWNPRHWYTDHRPVRQRHPPNPTKCSTANSTSCGTWQFCQKDHELWDPHRESEKKPRCLKTWKW